MQLKRYRTHISKDPGQRGTLILSVVYGHLATNEIATNNSTRHHRNNSAIIDTVYLPGIVTSS